MTILVTNRSFDVLKGRLLLMGAKTCSRVAGVISAPGADFYGRIAAAQNDIN